MARHPQQIAPDVLRLRAQNPSAMTGTGTNSYLIWGQDGSAVVIDPGPDLDSHFDALMTALNGARVAGILLTHAHLDHSALAPRLGAQTGAQVMSFGAAGLQRHGGEGVDQGHSPDVLLREGPLILGAIDLQVWHTPGHMQGHLCFGLRDMLFSGDHVMGWATSIVAPPEGDMAAYRASLRKLQGLSYARYMPGHGEGVDDPFARLAYLIDHRNQREAQVLSALAAQGAASADSIAAAVYTDTPTALLPAAALNVLAHLIELAARGAVEGIGNGPEAPNRTSLFALR